MKKRECSPENVRYAQAWNKFQSNTLHCVDRTCEIATPKPHTLVSIHRSWPRHLHPFKISGQAQETSIPVCTQPTTTIISQRAETPAPQHAENGKYHRKSTVYHRLHHWLAFTVVNLDHTGRSRESLFHRQVRTSFHTFHRFLIEIFDSFGRRRCRLTWGTRVAIGVTIRAQNYLRSLCREFRY